MDKNKNAVKNKLNANQKRGNQMEEQKNWDVIVVGAGLAGLSCAHALTARGKRVLILETHEYAGGRTSSFYDDGMPVESGLHRYIGYYSALPRLLKKCGVSLNEMVTWEEKADVLIKNENKKMVLGLAPVFAPLKTLRGVIGNRDCLSAREKLSLLPFFLCGFLSYPFSERLDSFSVTEYANRHHVAPRAQRLILEPLSSGIFFLPPENYSAYAFFGLFAPAILKFPKMRIGAYLGGMTKVMCNPIAEKIKAYGGEFRFCETVSKVLVSENCVVGVETSAGKPYYAPKTVLAVTLPAAKQILSPLRGRRELENLFRLPCMSACTFQMELDAPALKKDITCFGPGTDMVSFAEQSRTTFRGTKGRLSVILGNPSEYTKKDPQTILRIVVEQMQALGVHLDGHILRCRKVAEGNDFYSLQKGSQRLRPMQKTEIAGLVLAGDYTRTASFATMEGAVLSGEAAARFC